MDQHGNMIAEEGVTRCHCGSKYWERDLCIDCGADAQLVMLYDPKVEAEIEAMWAYHEQLRNERFEDMTPVRF